MDWMKLTLEQIVKEYKDGNPETLSKVDVKGLVSIIEAKINLSEFNIDEDEYNEILG